MHRLLVLIFLISYSFIASSETDVSSGNILLDHCSQAVKFYNGEEDIVDWQVDRCMNYLNGYMNGIEVHEFHGKGLICLSEGFSLKRIIMVVVNYLNKKPEYLQKNQAVLVWNALIEKFPCN